MTTKIKLQQLLDKYIKEYQGLDDSIIEKKSIELVDSLTKVRPDDYETNLDLKMQLESLKYIMDLRSVEKDEVVNNLNNLTNYLNNINFIKNLIKF